MTPEGLDLTQSECFKVPRDHPNLACNWRPGSCPVGMLRKKR